MDFEVFATDVSADSKVLVPNVSADSKVLAPDVSADYAAPRWLPDSARYSNLGRAKDPTDPIKRRTEQQRGMAEGIRALI